MMGGGGGGGGFRGTKGAKVEISDQRMYQDGNHFNKHGRGMGYASKREYDADAKKFARTYQDHPDAKIYEGVWNGTGRFGGKVQRVISFEGRSVVIDTKTGQVVDFYMGTEMRGLVHIIRIR